MEINKEEIWKKCENWENKYEVSTLGRIRSLARYSVYKNPHPNKGKGRTIPEKILTSWKNVRNGYLMVQL